VFACLRVWDTERNNGILIYVCLPEPSIELIADRGFERMVNPAYWAQAIKALGTDLHAGQWEAGLSKTIDSVSHILGVHFPLTGAPSKQNELPDAPAIQ
jgi:uncharacterized membrane protein